MHCRPPAQTRSGSAAPQRLVKGPHTASSALQLLTTVRIQQGFHLALAICVGVANQHRPVAIVPQCTWWRSSSRIQICSSHCRVTTEWDAAIRPPGDRGISSLHLVCSHTRATIGAHAAYRDPRPTVTARRQHSRNAETQAPTREDLRRRGGLAVHQQRERLLGQCAAAGQHHLLHDARRRRPGGSPAAHRSRDVRLPRLRPARHVEHLQRGMYA
jgi:hypothetical protein